MALNIGRKGWLGVALQSGFDVPANITDYMPFTNNTIHGTQQQIEVKHAVGHRESVFSSVPGKRFAEGNLDVNLDSKLAGYLLVSAMGSVSSSLLGSGVYEHTLTRNDSNTPQYLSAVSDRGGIDRQFYPNLAVDEMTIDNQLDIAMLKCKVTSSFPATTTSGTNTTASGNVFTFRNAAFAFAASVGQAANAANLKPHDLKFMLKNNTDPVHRHGSGDPASINAKQFDVDCDFNLYFEGTTERDAYYNQTKQAGVLQFNGNGIGGGYVEQLKVNLYQVSYKDYDLDTGLDNFYVIKAKLNGEFDNAAGKSVDMTLRNTKSSYI